MWQQTYIQSVIPGADFCMQLFSLKLFKFRTERLLVKILPQNTVTILCAPSQWIAKILATGLWDLTWWIRLRNGATLTGRRYSAQRSARVSKLSKAVKPFMCPRPVFEPGLLSGRQPLYPTDKKPGCSAKHNKYIHVIVLITYVLWH